MPSFHFLHRFMKLCHLEKQGVGHARSKRLFGLAIIFAILVNIPTPWVFGRDEIYLADYNITLTFCFIADNKDQNIFYIWGIIVAIVFIVVTIALVFFYTHIIRTLLTMSAKHEDLKRRTSLPATKGVLDKHHKSQVMRNSSKVFIVVTLVFVASYTPYFITLILDMVVTDVEKYMGPTSKAFYDLAKLSPILNTVANPIIYSFDSPAFRQRVKKMVTFKAFKKGFFRRRAFSTTNRSFDVSHISSMSDKDV